MTIANIRQTWVVLRLATLQEKNQVDRLLFATVTELAPGRPAPPDASTPERFPLKGTDDRLLFRRIVLPKDEAIGWYTALEEGETSIPTAGVESKGELRLQVPRLEDPQPWPVFGLPFSEGLLSSNSPLIKQAPFIGSVPARIHRRFGNRTGLEAFLGNADAHAFLARRMHVNLFDYQEYMGSAVYIAPDPIVRQIDHFMVPAKEGQGERILYRLVPRPGQRLDELRLTTFDKEARLLTRVETHPVPPNGIVVLDKGSCLGEYGFVLSHDKLGVLAYSPPTGFLRQMNLTVQVRSGKTLNVRVPSGSKPDAPVTEYRAASGVDSEFVSIHGEKVNAEAGVRVTIENRKRERQANARLYGQRWFSAGSRDDAMQFIRELLRPARGRVIIADPYLGALQLGQFLYAVSTSQVDVTLLTTKLAFKPYEPDETRQTMLGSFKDNLDQLKEHHQLVPRVVIISPAELHDRFLVVDDDVWFVGNSLNSLGEKASMIVRLPDPMPVIEQLQSLAIEGQLLDGYIRQVNKAGKRSGQQ